MQTGEQIIAIKSRCGTGKTLESLAKQYEEVSEDISSYENLLSTSQVEAKRLKFELKQAETNLHDFEQKDIKNARRMVDIQRKVNQSIRVKHSLEKAISSHELEVKVNALYDKQIDFWTALEGQIKIQQEEVNQYMQGLRAPLSCEGAIKRLKEGITNINFSKEAVDTREVQQRYEQSLREICKNKLEGTFVSSHDLKKPKMILDNFLFKPHIEVIWNFE